MVLSNGALLGPYEILDLVARGGMGEVYRAIDSRLGRKVAIKVLPSHLAGNPESLARFRREARAVAALSHPNIVSIFDIGTQADTPYVVTELLDGETLRKRLERGNLSLDDALPIALGIADGLAAAHAKGIIHRDLKPENVFLTTSGTAKILDFGLASTQPPLAGAPDGVTHTEALTEPGLIMGTIGYSSPEQLRGHALTPATDVFSFGCVLFEMFDGEMPFQRDSNIETLASVLHDEPFGRNAATEQPFEIRKLIERCLHKDAAKRFQNGAELAAALHEVAQSHAAGQLGTAPILRTKRLPRMTTWAPRLLAVTAIAIVATFVLVVAARRKVIDGGYDLRATDVTGTAETRRLTALGLAADAAGNRAEAIELMREAARRDARAPLPAAFAASFTYYNGDVKQGERWSAETMRRLPAASSPYETMLARYLLPENDNATLSALASSMLELRPKAWRLRLSLAHRHLDRREMPAMLAQLKLIDVSAPDDRRLTLVLADRASLGDIDGAERDLRRSRLVDRPALLAYTKARIAWSRGRAGEAARLYESAVESATIGNLVSVAAESHVLAGAARIGAGDFEGAQVTLDGAAARAHHAALPNSEVEAYAFGAYAAYRCGDVDGMERRLQTALTLADCCSANAAEMRLFALRTHAKVTIPPGDVDKRDGLASLVAAREAFSRGDAAAAARLLQQSRSEGVDDSWFREEAALLAYDLGAPAARFRPDPPYPNRLRFIAVWELARLR